MGEASGRNNRGRSCKSTDIGIRCERRESDSRCEEISGKTSHKGIVGGVENGNEKLPVCRYCFYITDAVSISGEALYKYRIEKVRKVVPGGETGQLSIYNGLIAAKEISNIERSIVLIHDGVRPLINEKLIKNNIETVKKYGSAITTAKVKETILVVNEGKATIDYVPSRNNSRVAKAPQSFWLDDILTVHEKSLADGEKNCIDSCTMMQKYGYDLYLIDGPSQNIKITTPEDFYTMRAILEAKENEQIYGIED